ncbi:BcepNY3gp33 [Burkholderia phage BcepNY3]|uniref:Gp36 n=2 Tax=Naesvirus TaxID=2733115 RepID=Q6UIZ5_9CAUD|nr:gp36 [Burkholderia phage Bcep1]YP_001294871.1 BcepNY3gp33 [Burkholderia phage BcepNY3]AAQ73383.1 gp36 [Burkholderia phage Bcep1]ABR10568.1 BcepNY3gp33 [Burkholderia phage BcepNY3]
MNLPEPNPKEHWPFQRRVLAAGVDAARNSYIKAQCGDARRMALAHQALLQIRIDRLTRP